MRTTTSVGSKTLRACGEENKGIDVGGHGSWIVMRLRTEEMDVNLEKEDKGVT